MEKGTILGEKYQLVALVGQGGMGAVWRAQHLGLDCAVALKLMSPELAAQPDAVARFTREAKAAASLRSPHVVQILDYGIDPKRKEPFIVMELLEGESLSSRIRQRRVLSPRETSKVIAQVARALTLAHTARIVHRDLKPDNIFLVANADEEIAKVLDFGIAKTFAALHGMHGQTVTGSMLGTPYYMSPEQITSAKSVDHRSDLWSLAVIACECLTGQRPFVADTAMGLAVMICQGQGAVPSSLGRVPAGFDEWFARGTALHRERRFQSATELSESLQALLERGGAARGTFPSRGPSGGVTAFEQSGLGALTQTASEDGSPLFERSRRSSTWPRVTMAVLALVGTGSGVWLLIRSSAPTSVSEAQPASAAPPPVAQDGRVSSAGAGADPHLVAPVLEGRRPKIEVVTPEPVEPAPSSHELDPLRRAAVKSPLAAEGAQRTPPRQRQRARAEPSAPPAPSKPKAVKPPPRPSFDPYENL